MKNRRTIAAILAAALTLTMCGVSAVAAGEADSSAAPDMIFLVEAVYPSRLIVPWACLGICLP